MTKRCFLAAGAAALLILSGAGCKSMGGGMPAGQAQVVVSGVLESQIEAKAEEVFDRHGFDFKGAGEGRMEFERPGGAMTNILYGNWQDNDTSTKVTLYITRKGPMEYALRTRSIVIRHTFGAGNDAELFDVQGARYKAILDKIKKELQQESAPAS